MDAMLDEFTQDAPQTPEVIVAVVEPMDAETQFATEMAALLENPDAEPVADLDALGTRLLSEFDRAEQDRNTVEQRWLKDLRQYKGIYEPDIEAEIDPHRSRSYVRKTRVKVKTIDSRVVDMLFPTGSEKNWSCEATPKPRLTEIAKAMMIEKANGAQLSPEQVEAAYCDDAKDRSRKMSRVIEDQLVESRYKDACVKTGHSGHVYGTGILKGPLVEKRIRTRFELQEVPGKDGNPVRKWVPVSEEYTVPFVENVPVWRFYPDRTGVTLEELRFAYELHVMPKHKLAELAGNKSFRGEIIKDYILSNPDGASKTRSYESELRRLGERTEAKNTSNTGKLYDVLERWGWIDGTDLRDIGVKVPEDRVHETFFANVWLLPDGRVIRAVLQPIDGTTWPYHLYYFDKDETDFFGEGIPAIMRDDQTMINAALRMTLDNAAITAGPQLEVVPGLLEATEDVTSVFPFKVWLRSKSELALGPAVRAIQLPNSVRELTALMGVFDANADEVTAIPRYMSGENVNQGAAGTASGMSMLMAAANIVIKDLITSWDEGITRTFIEGMYRWNMKFNRDMSIKGDFEVKARGTASLVAREVRAQQLRDFAAQTNNPVDGPLIKRDKLLREIAAAQEMSDIVKSEEDLKAERESEEAQKLASMQQQAQEAALSEAIAKAQRAGAEAELAKRKAEEIIANVELKRAQVDKTIAEMVESRVRGMFAALQAGGVATRDPLIAPAGDEIWKSAGGKDQNGDPGLDRLSGPPVQERPLTDILLNKGQGISPDTRVAQPGDTSPNTPSQPVPEVANPETVPDAAEIPSGIEGVNKGIETERIEQ